MTEQLISLTLLALLITAGIFLYFAVIHIIALCLTLTTNPDDDEN